MRDSMNKSSEPCEDIYNYACGNWISNTKLPASEYTWDKWQSINLNILERIEFILVYQHEQMSNQLMIAQSLFKNCVNRRIEFNGMFKHYKQNRPLFQFDANETTQNSWINTMMNAILKYDVYPLFKIHVHINMFNTSSNGLYVSILKSPESRSYFNYIIPTD